MGRRSRVALVLALVGLTAFAEACHHRAVATPDPPHRQQWILPERADDDDPFCVPSNDFVALPPRCTTVGEIRFHVRAQRWANE